MLVTCAVSMAQGSAAGASVLLLSCSCPVGAALLLGSAGASVRLRCCPAGSASASCKRQVDTSHECLCSKCMPISQRAKR